MRAPACQRWRDQRGSYRPAGEPIDPTSYGVEPIAEKLAKGFVCRHHYSASFPAARFRVGLFHTVPFFAPKLVGVAVFSVPPSQAVIPKWTGLLPHQGVELGRFVLLDDVPANGESWFLARALRLLSQSLSDVRAVLSFSDPMPRKAENGRLVMPGHVGTIYQASSARYVGRSHRQTLTLDRSGRVLSHRTLNKIRAGHKGAQGGIESLVAAGAPTPRPHEDGRDYVRRALQEGPFSKVRHPGNHAYLFAVGDRAARRVTARGFPEPLGYPKTLDDRRAAA